jgi:hypothetical protein
MYPKLPSARHHQQFSSPPSRGAPARPPPPAAGGAAAQGNSSVKGSYLVYNLGSKWVIAFARLTSLSPSLRSRLSTPNPAVCGRDQLVGCSAAFEYCSPLCRDLLLVVEAAGDPLKLQNGQGQGQGQHQRPLRVNFNRLLVSGVEWGDPWLGLGAASLGGLHSMTVHAPACRAVLEWPTSWSTPA